jgi:hypothetical protein
MSKIEFIRETVPGPFDLFLRMSEIGLYIAYPWITFSVFKTVRMEVTDSLLPLDVRSDSLARRWDNYRISVWVGDTHPSSNHSSDQELQYEKSESQEPYTTQVSAWSVEISIITRSWLINWMMTPDTRYLTTIEYIHDLI